MSEQHVEVVTTGNGAATSATPRAKKPEIAKSSIENGVVSFTFTDGTTVECDVAKLPPNVQFEYAAEGVRMSGRLSFQKMTDDPVKAANALRARFAKMASGDLTKNSRRAVNKEPDALVQALANLTGKSVAFIEGTWFPRYLASEGSGCTTSTVNGKTRMYGKKEAIEKLKLDPGIKPEYDKIVRERNVKANKGNPGKRLDLASIAA